MLFAAENLLPHMNAYDPALPLSQQAERSVLIFDNARVHDQAALALIESTSALVRLLPSFSPDFNPIEDVFSVGSIWRRHHATPKQFNAGPFYCIALMLPSITPALYRGFVKAAVRNYAL